MTWLKIDDGFPEHKKLLGLQRNERWTWIEILAYCARQSNGGVLPDGIEKHMKYVSVGYLQKCVELGLLDVVNGLFTVHDWNEYNPKDPTNSVRQARYRNAKRNAEVTEKVTARNVTNVTPPARAARPGPSPTNKEPPQQPTETSADDELPPFNPKAPEQPTNGAAVGTGLIDRIDPATVLGDIQ
jgi:hypothetical protein